MPDRLSLDLPGTAGHRKHARRAGPGRRVRYGIGLRRSGQAWAAGAITLLGLIAACSSAAGQPPSRVPARASLFPAIPAACSLITASTAPLLGLSAKGRQLESTQQGGVTEKMCEWTSSGSGPGRSLTVIVDLFTAATGQPPAAAAQSQFQQEVSTESQAEGSHARPVAGLADGAFIEHVTRRGRTDSLVQVRDQNVVVNMDYAGLGSSGAAPGAAGIDSAALTAARAIVAALPAS